MKQATLKRIPAVHHLQSHACAVALIEKYQIDLAVLTTQVKHQLDLVRALILQDKWTGIDPSSKQFVHALFSNVDRHLKQHLTPELRPVVNATGTVLHTNLGRSRLSEKAIEQVVAVARNYANIEYDLEQGVRGSRQELVCKLVKEVTGAEAAIVVNNNAAAVFMILSVFARQKEVIISRGQLVEIGGSFRISTIMEETGATLREVGTTNMTHPLDYVEAVTLNTAMMMKVHSSNFKVVGFTEMVESQLLAKMASDNQIISYEDLGSGALFDFERYGIGDEPLVSKVIASGVDLVSFSGDKLLGGPQAGIIAGKKELIDQLEKHQLARVLRVDKMTLAALESTLRAYKQGEGGALTIPTVREIMLDIEQVGKKADHLIQLLIDGDVRLEYAIKQDQSTIGGGTLPEETIDSVVVGVKVKGLSAAKLHKLMRTGTPAVVGKVQENAYWLDMRMVLDHEIPMIVAALHHVVQLANVIK